MTTRPARRFLEVNACASFGERRVHMMCWERFLWIGPRGEQRMRRDNGTRFTGRYIIHEHGGMEIPALCKYLYVGKWGHRRPDYQEPLVTSEPKLVTCAVCLSKLVMLGISCGCVR